MKQKELYEKAQLLKAGQIVEIAGNFFRAVHIECLGELSCCDQCDLDSICRDDVFDVCCEMETLESHNWQLKLAHRQKNKIIC